MKLILNSTRVNNILWVYHKLSIIKMRKNCILTKMKIDSIILTKCEIFTTIHYHLIQSTVGPKKRKLQIMSKNWKVKSSFGFIKLIDVKRQKKLKIIIDQF